MWFEEENEGSEARPPGSSSSKSPKLDGWMWFIASRPICTPETGPRTWVAVITTSRICVSLVRSRTVRSMSLPLTVRTSIRWETYPIYEISAL